MKSEGNWIGWAALLHSTLLLIVLTLTLGSCAARREANFYSSTQTVQLEPNVDMEIQTVRGGRLLHDQSGQTSRIVGTATAMIRISSGRPMESSPAR